jgi:hypothetical protein
VHAAAGMVAHCSVYAIRTHSSGRSLPLPTRPQQHRRRSFRPEAEEDGLTITRVWAAARPQAATEGLGRPTDPPAADAGWSGCERGGFVSEELDATASVSRP